MMDELVRNIQETLSACCGSLVRASNDLLDQVERDRAQTVTKAIRNAIRELADYSIHLQEEIAEHPEDGPSHHPIKGCTCISCRSYVPEDGGRDADPA
jgi:hypothetical protein